MTVLESKNAPTTAAEIEKAMLAFSEISDSLTASYEALGARAEHMEAELCDANAKLEQKVRELDEVNRHLEAILGSLPSGVVVRDSAGIVVRVNDAAVKILGIPADQLLHNNGPEVLEAKEAPKLATPSTSGQVIAPTQAGGNVWRTVEYARQDCELRVLATRRSPVRHKDRITAGSVEIIEDRTELTRMERRVHQLDKMAALGTMAGGIAHEIRNPLNAIRGFAGLLRRELDPDSKAARWASYIEEGSVEVDGIIASMLTFTSPERLRLETVDGARVIEEAVQAATRGIGDVLDSLKWSVQVEAPALSIAADHIKLRQALRNLIANAFNAQPQGGSVTISLREMEGDACFIVSDAGPGIPTELLDRVTDPFYTTRADGTGLGLALVHAIAQLHGGRLEIKRERSSLGGACVHLRIPITASL